MKASSDHISPESRSNRQCGTAQHGKRAGWHLLMGIALFTFFTGYSAGLKAQQSITYKQELDGAAGQLAKDSSRTVMDSVFLNPGSFPAIDPLAAYKVSNIIVFHINETSPRMLPDSFKAELTLRVYFTNGNNVSDSVTEKKLNIDYYKSRAYNNKAVYYFGDARLVTVKVTDISSSYAALATILPLLKLENRMVINRVFAMDCENDAITSVSHSTATVSTKGELKVSWASLNAAQEYDLEWTFIDQSALDAGWYNTGGTLDAEKLFRNNATRVTIHANNYNIPLLYEGNGKLFYRVRAAQTMVDKERKVTLWSSDFISQGGLGGYVYSGHELSLNWQAATSFAEEGKRKSVVQYFDGTLRNRQTVTKDNTTDTTLVAETFYDKQGRAVIQVLPAPTLSSLISYNPLFNQARVGITTVENTPAVYDTLETAADYCAGGAPPLDSVSGASQYYSYNNPNKLNPIHKFIPQAKGYPFTEVKYSQDNTGRIVSQGGVGPQFRLHSGHETKYYYGTPLQTELDALFGTEAGYASHYQKNMVRDANGQYSVSYVDMHGRTVATALAGAVPDSMQALASFRDSIQTDNLLTPVNNVIKGNTIESTSALLVTKAGVDSFFYKLNAESLQLDDKDAVTICYDCLYDLTITISDDCNNQNLPGDSLFVFHKSNMRVQPPAYDTTCTIVADTFDVVLGVELQEGSYLVTKKLTLRQDAMAYYRDSLYTPHNTVRTKEDIIAEQLSRIREQRGNDCAQEGQPWYSYQQYHEQMLLDMTPPFGQYARYPNDPNDPRNQGEDYLNLFSIFDKEGSPGVYVYKNIAYTGSYPRSPNEMSPEDFISNFQPQWAEDLVREKHPEGCLLREYESYKASHHWDADFEATDTYQQALAKGYLNPTNSTNPPASGFGNGNDSLFFTNPGAKSWFNTALLNYKTNDDQILSLWAAASIIAHCDTEDATCVNSFQDTPSNVFNSSFMGCEGELDMAWRFFRSEYLRLKRGWIDGTIRSACSFPVLEDKAAPVFLDETAATGLAGNLLSTDRATAQQAAADTLSSIANSTCLAYAQSWWRQLAGCNYNATDSAIIMPRLVEVCKQGSDTTHPFGASSVRPASTYTYSSFDEVISQYNASIGKPNNAACNAYLIDAPGPYNRPVLAVEQPLYTKPDDCTCEKIGALKTQYETASGYSSFSDYIQKTLHTTISQNALDSLLNLCNGNIACRYIAKPITLPPALQCATGYDVCVDCNAVNSVYTSFKSSFPGIIPTYEEINEQHQTNNRLFASYMNNKLGFSKPAQEYLAFMDSCGAAVATPCDSLQKMVAEYVWDTATNCQTAFTNYFNQQKSTSYTYEQVDSVYFNTCGNHLDVCGGDFPLKDSLLLLADSFKTNYDFINDDGVDTGLPPIHWGSGGLSSGTGLPIRSNDLSMIVDTGVIHMPTGSGPLYYSSIGFSKGLCIENEYAFEVRIKNPVSPSQGGDVVISTTTHSINTDSTDIDEDIAVDFVPNIPQASFYRVRGVRHYDTSFSYKDFEDWRIIKLSVKPDSFRIYYEGNLIFKLQRDGRSFIDRIGPYLSFQQGVNVQVDWVKYYGTNDELAFFEDFNDTANLASPVEAYQCPSASCSTKFTRYFNLKQNTAYTFSQIDSIYTAAGVVLDVCGLDTATIRCDQLENYVDEYKDQLGQPASGYVDLDMRTFAGNKTPDEGPKGVFDVKGKLLGNTADSTPTAVKQSYVQIWNGSADNRAVGALSLLENGKFRLTLNPGKQAPKEGIVGQRYYQFDTPNDYIDAIRASRSSYIDFGDSSYIKIDSAIVQDSTEVTSSFYVKHTFSNAALRTITVYHSDLKGVLGFDNAGSTAASISNLKNMRGYAPEELWYLAFHSTQDSSLNTFNGFRNKDNISSILKIQFGSGDGVFPFLNYNFGQLSNNHNLKRIWTAGNTTAPKLNNILPDLKNNCPSIEFLLIRGNEYSDSLDLALPNIKYLDIQYGLTTAQVDRILMQLAPAVTRDSVLIYLIYGNQPRSSASDSAVALLKSKGAFIHTNGNDDPVNVGPTYPDYNLRFDPLKYLDFTLPFSNPFTDFINSKFNSNLTAAQVDSLYLARCGHKPNWYAEPDTSFPAGLLLCGKNEPVSPTLTYEEVYDPPCSDSSTLAFNSGTEIYTMYRDSLNNIFDSLYTAKCLGAAALEQFTVKRNVSEYHYTLYYYDQAGNLVKTVAPSGVNPNRDSAWLTEVAGKRKLGQTQVPAHAMPTLYRYNSLNQVVSQKTPDAGKSSNWYDRLGRLAISQNAQQKLDGKYSYTRYDVLGRITEVGQKPQSAAMTNAISRDTTALADWLFYNNNGANGAEMVTQTVYDQPGIDATACIAELRFTQKPYTLRNRVSYTRYYETPAYYNGGDGRYYISGQSYATGIDYSYDIHGNVDTMRNLYGALQYGPMANHGYNACKTIAYTYDLISGKVNEVHYNPGQNDEFYHRYEYDAENRLTDVYTTDNKIFLHQQELEEHDAFYRYYKHGPLARVVLSQIQVQGLDYNYTLQGWLKGINASAVRSSYDPGLDGGGSSSSANRYVGSDNFGLTLNYFRGDYTPINTTADPYPDHVPYMPVDRQYNALYNGNISSMMFSMPLHYYPHLYNYKYDQLNRLVSMDVSRNFSSDDNHWQNMVSTDLHMEKYSYDGNGNIKTVLRNGNLSANPLMDSLTYFYTEGTNRLDHIRDQYNESTAHNNNYIPRIDLKDQLAGSYTYDAIGNLKSSAWMGDDDIKWNIYGKVVEVEKRALSGVNSRFIHYYYDPSGNKTGEAVRYGTGSPYYNHRWYVRDAQGNVLATYEVNNAASASAGTLNLSEHHFYGSSRLGIVKRSQDMDEPKVAAVQEDNLGDTYLLNFTRGNKLFEVTNHLGNVVMVLADLREGLPNGNNPLLVRAYRSVIVYSSDYTPFGRAMAGRTSSLPSNYRYGFNGKEYDNEVQAAGNLLDYGNRLYDPMVGRFWSVDPITNRYPELTPYQYASNTPIWAIDIDGAEGMIAMPDERTGRLNTIASGEIKRFVIQKHSIGMRNVSIAEHARQMAIKQGRVDGDGINWYTKSLLYIAPWWNSTAKFSDANDGAVLMSGKNLDGSEANFGDYTAAGVGLFIPFVSGSGIKKAGSALIEGTIGVFKNGKEVRELAYKIGKVGHKGTKEYNSVLKSIQSGGNIVANSKEEALQFLKEALPGIVDESGKTASKFGYRIDDVGNEVKDGLKQGHQGLHINYYDKENKLKGTILIEEATKPKK